MKQFFLFLLTLCLCSPNMTAETKTGSCGDNVTYSLDTETGALTISGTGAMANYYSSSAPWYSNRSYIKTATIEDGVTSIGMSAFSGYSGLTSVTLGNSVISIGRSAFSGCSGLTGITISNSVTSIGVAAFSGCSGLTGVTIGNSVTSIGSSAFWGCSGLTGITIPNSVTSIGDGAFSVCTGLTGITIPNSVTSIGSSAFYGCRSLTSITIPNSVTSIESSAFYGCSGLTGITIPDGVTSIGESAFSYCSSLTSITIPNSVTSIGESAFYLCTRLTGITIPDGVTSIGSSAFSECYGLTAITIPNSVTSIGNYAFSGCSGLTSITLGDGVTSIGSYAFSGCSGLTEIHSLNPAPPSVGGYAFSGVSAKIYVPEGSKAAYQAAGGWREFANILEEGGSVVTGICGADGANLTWSLDTEDSTLTISGNGAMADYEDIDHAPWYYNRSQIKTVVIEKGVTSIGEYAFYGCSGLTEFTVSEGNAGYSAIDGVLFNKEKNTLVLYPNAKAAVYVIPDGVTSIGGYAFQYCSGLTSVTIPNSVTNIEEAAFEWCTGLTGITIPNSVTVIGEEAFESCTGLTSVIIGNSVTNIGEEAFHHCEGLANVIIGSSVTNIEFMAFADCVGLTEIHSKNPTPPSTGEDVFGGEYGVDKASCRVYVPSGAIAAYQAAGGWSAFTYILEEEEGELVDVTGVTLDRQTLSLEVGSTSKLTATIAPANASNKAVTWTTGNPAVATVSASGLVTAIAAGQAIIAVTTADGGYTDSCEVTVEAKVEPEPQPVYVTGVTLDRTSLTLETGSTSQLTATIAPANASNKRVSWTTGNPAVATVSASGLVTAIAAGQAIIAVTTADGGYTDSCEVTVEAKVEPEVPGDTVIVKDSVVYNIIYKDSVVYNIKDTTIYNVTEVDTTVYNITDTTIYNVTEVDTTVYNITDTIIYNVTEVDTTVYNFITKDSIKYDITVRDSVIYNITEMDSIVYDIIHKDSIDYTLVPDTVYIPVVTDISGAEHVVTADARVSEEGGGILIEGLEPNAEFSIYTVAGEKYYTGTADAAGEARLAAIDEGLYILFFRDKAGKGQYSKFYHRK